VDTNVAIHLRDGDEVVTAQVAALEGTILLSVITRAELDVGGYRTPFRLVFADRAWMRCWRSTGYRQIVRGGGVFAPRLIAPPLQFLSATAPVRQKGVSPHPG
jgi:hypothetical protein